MTYDVRIVEAPRRDLAVVRSRTTFAEIPAFMATAFERVAAVLGPRGLLGDGPAVGRYAEMDQATGAVTVSAGFVVDAPIAADGDVVPEVLPAVEVATTTHLGPYDRVSEAYDAIAAAMALHGRELDESMMWEEYWSPPGTPDDETRTVVFCPLRPAT
ncbi:GyrI-like domain-containing protein [Agromyces bracchium]|uniref:Transcription activator effector-binding protein n=1 Tax=Agromyces bracchium TaxID=88376 RepID=A0A6I3MDT2_9MICO|nr:GyrI-like domain-containing protein [Agromyces bracchium]MTH70147.1 transcription activator effector-binding protein [Agromyces bracchium]